MFYFVLHNEIQEGPHAAAEVKRLLREGRYTPESLCWRADWEGWRPLSSVVGLVPKYADVSSPSLSGVSASAKSSEDLQDVNAGWSPDRTGPLDRRVVILLVAVLLLGAACTVLAVLLVDAQSHNQHQTERAVSRAELERGLLEASVSLRGPQPADEIHTWVTYEDAATGRPVAVSRANVLIYPEEMVADVLRTSGPGAAQEMMSRLQSTLPPPWRETITDSSGVASISGMKPGKYVVIVFAQKTGSGEPENYFWVARRQVDEHPSQALVLSEKNATTPKSSDFLVID
ncbi:MAG: DUF4339 domain-containing protein [bacterium]